jgi:phage-related protein
MNTLPTEIRTALAQNVKEIGWIASSRKDMKALPRPVQRTFGYALNAAQMGETPPEVKPLKCFGGMGVLELI